MVRERITKRVVDAVKPSARDVFVWDQQLHGFGLKVTPKGRKVFLAQYRLGGRAGRTQRVTLGSFGPITVDQARQQARHVLGQSATGHDPAGERAAKRAIPRFSGLLELFLTDHVDAKLKPSTAKEYRRLTNKFIRPSLGHMQINDIKRSDVARLHLAMKPTPYQANYVLAVMSKLFTWAEKYGYRIEGSNPCRHIEKYQTKRRQRFLTDSEMAKLGQVLTDVEREGSESSYVITAVRLLVFTGARLSEILNLRWDQVDFERALLLLSDSKTGAKPIFLSAPALEVLASVPHVEDNPYVICGGKQGASMVNLQKPWRRIRKLAGLDEVRLHDLRHSFASVAAAGGSSLPMIGRLLGHTQAATTQRYAHLAADPVKAANEAIGKRIAATMKGSSGKVIKVPQYDLHR